MQISPPIFCSSLVTNLVHIEALIAADDIAVARLMQRSLAALSGAFASSDATLLAMHRRVSNLAGIYCDQNDTRMFVAKPGNPDANDAPPLGCAGLGPLHGLPLSEGVGEIRDLVVDHLHQGQGIGTRLLTRCIAEAKALGFRRLYLETSPAMKNAQKLFLRSGFRPIRESSKEGAGSLPCYFILENL